MLALGGLGVARKLLVVVWHVLAKEVVDHNATDERVARSLFAFAYKVGVANLRDGLSAKAFTRQQLDRLGIGQELVEMPWGSKKVRLPPPRALTKQPADQEM